MDCASVMYGAATDSVSLPIFLPQVELISLLYEDKFYPALFLRTDVVAPICHAASAGRYRPCY